MSPVAKYLSLPREQRALLRRSAGLLAINVLRTRVPAFHLVPEQWQCQGRPAGEDPHENWHSIAWAVRTAARYIPGASCLPQAMTAWTLLRDAGYRASVRVGVHGNSQTDFRAHAWTASDNIVVVGESDLEFQTLTHGAV